MPATVSSITPARTQTGTPARDCGLTGTGFTGTCAVTVGGASATNVTVVSTTRVTFTAPIRTTGGVVAVIFVNGDGTVVTKPNFFTYDAPSASRPAVRAIPIVNTFDWDELGAAACGEGVTYVTGSGAPGAGNDDRAFGTFTDLLTAGPVFSATSPPAADAHLSNVGNYCQVGGWDRGFVISTGDVIKLRDHQTAVGVVGYEGFVSTDFTPAGSGPGAAVGDYISFTLEFIPTYPILVIPLTFTTEEIPNFVGLSFNDQISVKLNGQEIAFFPDMVTPINIDNYATLGTRYYFRGGRIYGLLEGTVAIYLVAFVTPGETQTLDVTVQDLGDGRMDSAAFIGTIWSEPGRPTNGPPPDDSHEGCPGCESEMHCFFCSVWPPPPTPPGRITPWVERYKTFVGHDTRILGFDPLGAIDDDEIYLAYIKTRAYQPGGDLAHQGEVAHTAQPLLIARPSDDTALYLDIIRDLEYETQRTSVDLTPVGSERRVIRKYESAAMGDATEVQFRLGDIEPNPALWDLHWFSVRLTPGGMR